MMPDFREEAMALLRYDPETGRFFWTQRQGRQAAGSMAGKARCGYVTVTVLGRSVQAHRLAWLFMTGRWPPKPMSVDHVNRCRSDNRWANLRLADPHQNTANQSRRSDNSSGTIGVAFHRQIGRWRAYLSVRGKQIALGCYATREEAVAARLAAETKHFGEFAPQQG